MEDKFYLSFGGIRYEVVFIPPVKPSKWRKLSVQERAEIERRRQEEIEKLKRFQNDNASGAGIVIL